MQRGLKTLLVAGVATLVMAPLQARADGFVSPWIGLPFGDGDDNPNNGRGGGTTSDHGRTTFGISAGGMRAGIIGGEVDFGYRPRFFGDPTAWGSNAVTTLMGNVMVGFGTEPGASIRPYVTGGLGLVHTRIDGGTLSFAPSSVSAPGWNAGVGVMGQFTDHLGLRGDLRYATAFHDMDLGIDIGHSLPERNGLNAVHFWRASVGIVFR